SNFNDKANLQGTGSTIVEISPAGHVTRFAGISRSGLPGACLGGIGLTTALAVVHGWVIVGSLPSASGMAATAKAGCLLVLDRQGRVRETIAGHGMHRRYRDKCDQGDSGRAGAAQQRGDWRAGDLRRRAERPPRPGYRARR